ncbi:MAG: transposase, partial [Myxococcales bacterium]|nr:transposase [Myxococcales bacterium]
KYSASTAIQASFGRSARLNERGTSPGVDRRNNICYSSYMKQTSFPFPKPKPWGGKRKGAGRPRKRQHPGLDGPGVPHKPRPEHKARHPVHLTLRVQPGIAYLRGERRAKSIVGAIQIANRRDDFQVVEYVILGNHLHLIAEAESSEALSRGMQRFEIRIAKRLNSLQNRQGSVFTDRYHAHTLKTPREVAHALRYLRGNYRRHSRAYLAPRWHDPLAGRVATPRTWLLATSPPVVTPPG